MVFGQLQDYLYQPQPGDCCLRWQWPLACVQGVWDYRILVSDAAQRPQAALYGFNLRDRIPSFLLPLQPEDSPIVVDLQPLLHTVYEQGNFDLRIDYQQPALEPALSDSDRLWVQECITSSSKE